MNRRCMTLAFAAVGVFSIACAQNQNTPDLQKKLAKKTAENAALAKKADEITGKLGDLAKAGKLPTDDEAIALMRKMVEELSAIHDQLKQQNEEIAELYKETGVAKDKQGGSGPSLDSRVSGLEKVKFSGYEQFQYRNSNQTGKEEDAFYDKRTRINMEVKPDNKNVGFKFSADFAGNQAPNKDFNGAITKDAYVHYVGKLGVGNVPLDIMAGQFPATLGYELARSDADREMPERSVYNSTLFKGERYRGVNIAVPIAGGWKVQGGIVDPLTPEDTEQSGIAPSAQHGRLAGEGAITKTTTKKNKNGSTSTIDMGVSGLIGRRPAFVGASATSPEVDRKYGEFYANFLNIGGRGIDWRNEIMGGTDRVPNSNPSSPLPATNMNGFSSVLGVNVGKMHRFDIRWDQFNPNTAVAHKTVNEYSVEYTMNLGSYKLVFGRDKIKDEAQPVEANVTTIRVQFKF